MDKKINTYEISFLLNSAEEVEAVMKHLSDFGAEIVSEGAVSEIELSYPIEKKDKAFFGYIHFNLDTEKAGDLNHALNLDKKIIRYLIITPPPRKATRPVRSAEGAKREKKTPSPEAALSNEALGEELAALQSE